jgi:hypothetical protein
MKSSPILCLTDEDIDKYLPKSIEEMKVGDMVSMTVKFRVSGVSKSEREEYDMPVMLGEKKDDKEPEKKSKMRRTVDLELIDSSKSNSTNDGKAEMQTRKGAM